jgi:short chain dehydrogenase
MIFSVRSSETHGGTMTGILDGKVAIVTGAGRGLGRAMTLGLLDAGARVAAVELDAPAIEETQDVVEDRGAGERFLGIGADVTHDESGAKILHVTTERFRPPRYPDQQCRHQHRISCAVKISRSENCGKRRRKNFAGSSTSTSLPLS